MKRLSATALVVRFIASDKLGDFHPAVWRGPPFMSAAASLGEGRMAFWPYKLWKHSAPTRAFKTLTAPGSRRRT